jgi:hypothetical protein
MFLAPDFCDQMGCTKEEASKWQTLKSDVNAPADAANSILAGDPDNFRVQIHPKPGENNSAFLNPDSKATLACTKPAPVAQPESGSNIPTLLQKVEASLTHPRVRGYPAQIVGVPSAADPSHPSTDSFLSNQLYYPGQNAQFGIKSNSGNPATSSLVGAIGIPVPLPAIPGLSFPAVVPYVGFDRETNNKKSTATNPQPPFSPNTFDVGLVAEAFIPHQNSGGPGMKFLGQSVAIRPDYNWNWADSSQLFSVDLNYIPLTTAFVNQCSPVVDNLCGMLLANAITEFGIYPVKGHPVDDPNSLHDGFVRIGGQLGLAAIWSYFDNNPIDASVSYADFLAPVGFHKSLGLVQTSLTWNIGEKKIVGVTASYLNGRQFDTAQRIQQWSLGLSLHY